MRDETSEWELVIILLDSESEVEIMRTTIEEIKGAVPDTPGMYVRIPGYMNYIFRMADMVIDYQVNEYRVRVEQI